MRLILFSRESAQLAGCPFRMERSICIEMYNFLSLRTILLERERYRQTDTEGGGDEQGSGL